MPGTLTRRGKIVVVHEFVNMFFWSNGKEIKPIISEMTNDGRIM